MLRKPKDKPILTEEQRKQARLPDARSLHSMQAARFWSGWESRGLRPRFAKMGDPQ